MARHNTGTGEHEATSSPFFHGTGERETIPNHSFHDTRESESISNPFSYQSQGMHNRTKNVILFGEGGAGKSSVVNLLAGRQVASIGSDMRGCTLEATSYHFNLAGVDTPFQVFDTVGLHKPGMDLDTSLRVVEKARELIATLYNSGGIDLLLFCIRGGRVTRTMQQNYRLFFEFLCDHKVPIAVVVTHLENEDIMENWWDRNDEVLEGYGIRPVAHACITAIPARVTRYADKRIQSGRALGNLFVSALNGNRTPYTKPPRGWMTAFARGLLSHARNVAPFRRNGVAGALQERCGFSPQEARGLTRVIARHNA